MTSVIFPSMVPRAARRIPRTRPLSTELLGYLAAAGTTFAFLPQVIRVWRTRSAKDISTAMYIIFLIGVALWILYGFRIHSAPVIAANIVTLVLAACVLAGKFVFRDRD